MYAQIDFETVYNLILKIHENQTKMSSRATIIAENLVSIKEKVLKATERRAAASSQPARLVAVSKTKPLEDVMAAYQHGHRVFGENYVFILISDYLF